MTTRMIYGEEDRLLPWARERIGLSGFRPDAYTIGLERDGDLVAVVVYDGFTDTDCNMHIASDGTRRWMNKELLVSAFSYPFIQLRMQRVTGLVPAYNQAALQFDEHLGFKREGLHRKALPGGGDIVSLGMIREECRFIPQEHR